MIGQSAEAKGEFPESLEERFRALVVALRNLTRKLIAALELADAEALEVALEERLALFNELGALARQVPAPLVKQAVEELLQDEAALSEKRRETEIRLQRKGVNVFQQARACTRYGLQGAK